MSLPNRQTQVSELSGDNLMFLHPLKSTKLPDIVLVNSHKSEANQCSKLRSMIDESCLISSS